ncbi:MAG: ABC transporter ATP-binding protein [Arachnia sp.]
MNRLEVSELTVAFGRRRVVAVDRLSFTLGENARLGIIGQSGSGKSVTALAMIGLLPENAHVTGSVKLNGQELIGRSERDLRRLRGDEVSMIFQEPMTALDPTMRVGRQIGEVIALHRTGEREPIRDVVELWLARVGMADPARVAQSYPDELSGGQRQRALVAMALANQPGLVICDEPTTALDVIVQRQILDLLDEQLAGRAALFVSHDLAVVRQVCHEALVMLKGRVVESGSIRSIIDHPQHPYTRALVAAARIGDYAAGSRLPTLGDFEEGRTT